MRAKRAVLRAPRVRGWGSLTDAERSIERHVGSAGGLVSITHLTAGSGVTSHAVSKLRVLAGPGWCKDAAREGAAIDRLRKFVKGVRSGWLKTHAEYAYKLSLK